MGGREKKIIDFKKYIHLTNKVPQLLPYPKLLHHPPVGFTLQHYKIAFVSFLILAKQPKESPCAAWRPAGAGKAVNNLPGVPGVTLGFSGKARVTAGSACTLKGGRAWISTPLGLGGSSPVLRVFQGFFVPGNQSHFLKRSSPSAV